VVVFVGDTTIDGWPETASRLAELRAALDDREGTPVGLVFQANKRDLPDVISMEEVRARASDMRTAVVESVAGDGTGVREAFVFAVRLALDRVRSTGTEIATRDGFGSERGVELVDLLRTLDIDVQPDAREPASVARGALPRPPSQDAPSGFVWPPVEGRILLRDAARASPRVERAEAGDFAGSGTGWTVHSSAAAVYDDVEQARGALVRWARRHAAAQDVLSRHRCIVLAETGDGRWRLWQIVRTEATLRSLAVRGTDRLLESITTACARAALPVACTLDTIGVSDLNQPVFVGLMPTFAEAG
jgi:hypothetical protein